MIRLDGTGVSRGARGDDVAERIGLADLSGRIAAELGHMTCLATGLQISFSRMLHPGGKNPADLAGLQSIDCLTQLLADLSRLMVVIADAAPPSASLTVADIREVIVLRGFLQRIIAPVAACEPDKSTWSAGEVQWL